MEDCEAKFENLISETKEKMKADKAPKEEIKATIFRLKANMITELENIEAKYI